MREVSSALERHRKLLLAKIHIAKKDLGLDDDIYREILFSRYKVMSAGRLRIANLEDMTGYLKSLGWKPQRDEKPQVEALRVRITEEASKIENGEKRLAGLVKKVAGVDRLQWCRDVGKLKRILKILGQL